MNEKRESTKNRVRKQLSINTEISRAIDQAAARMGLSYADVVNLALMGEISLKPDQHAEKGRSV